MIYVGAFLDHEVVISVGIFVVSCRGNTHGIWLSAGCAAGAGKIASVQKNTTDLIEARLYY